MVYITYEKYLNKYHNAQENLNDIINEKEKYFAITQPAAAKTDKENVSGTPTKENPFATYVIKMEDNQVEERLTVARSIVKDRKELLNDKEEELRKSKQWCDIAYVYKYLENMQAEEIISKMPYCRSSIYEILRKIRENISSDKIG